MTGKIYLLPVCLGGDNYNAVIPAEVLILTGRLRYFIVEEIRSARRFLRLIDKSFPIDECVFSELNEHTGDSEIPGYLDPVLKGYDAGIMSEAGLPGIADPGSKVISLAHRKNIRVIPLAGPSSIILALAASGFNGQNFTFHGYLPVKPPEKAARIRELERSLQSGYAQVFMETPYRNQKMVEALTTICSNDTKLCIAADITLPTEFIMSMKISEWKKNIPSINGRPAIFILQ
jgi:16S rRNA (cytidine1402-2'-O)-methyltransferase